MLNLVFMTMTLARALGPFTNHDLKRTLAGPCAGRAKCVFYMWSPNMPLSIQGLPEAAEFARREKLHFIPLLDDQSDPTLAAKVAKERGLPKDALVALKAEDLIKLGTRVHFPSYVFAKSGKFSSPLLPGYKSDQALRRLTKSFLR